jgi:hypothetical protein
MDENPYKSLESAVPHSSEVDETAARRSWFASGSYLLLSVFFAATALGFTRGIDELGGLIGVVSCGFVSVVFARRALRD